jgi:hypothetical protein
MSAPSPDPELPVSFAEQIRAMQLGLMVEQFRSTIHDQIRKEATARPSIPRIIYEADNMADDLRLALQEKLQNTDKLVVEWEDRPCSRHLYYTRATMCNCRESGIHEWRAYISWAKPSP